MIINKTQIELGEVSNSCFVVMPFNSLFQTEYEKIIQPALIEMNIECIRGDEIYSKQRIVDDIWDSIKKCRFVLAELTGRNPNVLYEIGLAHAIGKPVIIITRNGDDVPFDLKALRYLYYDVNEPFWGENLKSGIQNLVKKVIENPSIENYLGGIEISDIRFPDINNKLVKTKKPVKILHDISGTWKGTFNIGGVHEILLQINQNETELIGTAIITYYIEKTLSVVQQIMNGSIKDKTVILSGVNYTYVERGLSDDYYLDSFKMEISPSKTSMKGKSSDTDNPEENGEIELKKMKTAPKKT